MAKRLSQWTRNPEIVGSIPRRGNFFKTFFKFFKGQFPALTRHDANLAWIQLKYYQSTTTTQKIDLQPSPEGTQKRDNAYFYTINFFFLKKCPKHQFSPT